MPIETRTNRPPFRHATCDCHVHVFDDPETFPFENAPAYAPPYSPASALLTDAARAGVSCMVLVQPTPYGRNLDVLKKSLKKLGARARGVGVADALIDIDALADLRAEGIAGLRFVENLLPDGNRMPGTVPLDALLQTLAPKMLEVGVHAEVWAPLSVTLERWPALEKAGIPIVLDHMGGFDPQLGLHHPHFQRLLGLLRDGAVWVKLALCRRAAGIGYDAIRPFHDAMIEANSDRLLWATDFPFVRFAGTPPTIEELLALFEIWVSDHAVKERILLRNPIERYGFEASLAAL
nr:amidohydrolase family protein [Rhizobium sp. P38BS-XIX]